MLKIMGSVCVLAALALYGCADSGNKQDEKVETGTVALPLTSVSPAGTQYHLRNATFVIQRPYYYCNYYTAGGYGSTSTGPSDACEPITVSSETDPNASSIVVDLEEGYYEINLLPDWTMERIDGGVSTPVEAQLLSYASQGVYVSRHSTYWITYQFGIGEYSLWFNGKLNIEVQVYDNPEQLYGPGAAGSAGMPYWPAGGAVATGGSTAY